MTQLDGCCSLEQHVPTSAAFHEQRLLSFTQLGHQRGSDCTGRLRTTVLSNTHQNLNFYLLSDFRIQKKKLIRVFEYRPTVNTAVLLSANTISQILVRRECYTYQTGISVACSRKMRDT
ncbi:hypothetical protein OUZ56_005804 [Daphnia magna]|uniref:Uncharacterized protein n=1 Tax=Daphnia magna TaxID=35525 RepID=A0ABQ9YU25_9CRUS|nr:hypothetical protein OUZ56_005804 [Daphnia magna]